MHAELRAPQESRFSQAKGHAKSRQAGFAIVNSAADLLPPLLDISVILKLTDISIKYLTPDISVTIFVSDITSRPTSEALMNIRRPNDLGAAVKEARRKRGMNQTEFATRLEINRESVSRLERGDPGITLGIVLRALNVLGLSLTLDDEGAKPAVGSSKAVSGKPRSRIGIDEIVDD